MRKERLAFAVYLGTVLFGSSVTVGLLVLRWDGELSWWRIWFVPVAVHWLGIGAFTVLGESLIEDLVKSCLCGCVGLTIMGSFAAFCPEAVAILSVIVLGPIANGLIKRLTGP